MNLSEALNYCRMNPDSVVGVFASPVNGMKGPKRIRYNEDEMCFEGSRSGDYSTLDKHWLVITQPGATFTAVENRAQASQAPALNGNGNGNAVDGALRSLNEGLRLLQNALGR